MPQRLPERAPEPGDPVSLRGVAPRRFAGTAPSGFGYAKALLARAQFELAKGSWKEELRTRCRTEDWPLSRAALIDEAGKIRALTEGGGSDDSVWTMVQLYDRDEKLRFLFVKHAGVDGSAGEYLVAFSTAGAMVGCNLLVLGVPSFNLCAVDQPEEPKLDPSVEAAVRQRERPAPEPPEVMRFADFDPGAAFEQCLPENGAR